MRNLSYHVIRAKNILCFGPEGIEIHFKDFGNIIQVKGINMDAPGTSEDPASNGAGKSSLQELLSIAIYGRTIKSPTKNKANNILNCSADKGELEFQWDDFRILRTFKRDSKGAITSKIDVWQSPVRIWDDSSKISFTTEQTKKYIEQNIALSHHAFCNVGIFDDSNTYAFLEADTPRKREIVENLLDLEQYCEYHQNCKDELKELNKKIGTMTGEYNHLKEAVEASERRIATVAQQETTWRTTKQTEINALSTRIKSKQQELESTDTGAELSNWKKSRERIASLNEQIIVLEDKKTKIQEAIKAARQKVDVTRTEKQSASEAIQTDHLAIKTVQSELDTALKLIKNLEGLKEGTKCPTCHGVISSDNYGHVLKHGHSVAEKCQLAIDDKTAVINQQKEVFSKKSSALALMEEKIGEAEGKVAIVEGEIRKHQNEIGNLLKIPKPEGNASEQILEAAIVELKKTLKSKQEELEGQSPYKEIIEQAEAEKASKEAECEAKAAALQEVEAEVPYYEYWLEAFGDNGIRKFVIDGIIPALNERVSYWLQILIDGLIEVSFDNKLEETIIRNGNPASYHNMSKGEVRRINLAVSQSFAYIMMLNSGCCPTVVFLDEITGGGIDRAGVPYVYNMILELAKERQVFVTTHNEVLMSLLQGCETLTLKKQNDITVLVK